MAAKSSATAASPSTPLLLFATATSQLAEPQNAVLLYKPGGVAASWKTNEPNTGGFVMLVLLYNLNSHQRDSSAWKILINDEHSGNMCLCQRSRNELWRKEKAKQRVLLMMGSEVAIPKAWIAKDSVSSSHHPGTEKLSNLSTGKEQVIGRE